MAAAPSFMVLLVVVALLGVLSGSVCAIPIIGTVALIQQPPSSLVYMDSTSCAVTTISAIPGLSTELYYIYDQAAAMSNGWYYANFLTSQQMKGER